ncbi:ATP-binding cassette sub-family A member 12 [Trachemys scripta elegans]|uniref:ATP-binding cassette sub-family A member 12 n=1 Tax=Trachemys scripta elegans TaxID=31138 RepID=UPI001551CC55|nr:ATP-binding cassette sub-family A member 12 [Trachemys scripta elegans]
MASLFQHLRILLWKNWLSVKRQPLWSFTLISWPLIVFIILAIVRIKFPPEPQPNCYLAPRNLPSAGFFPFLQTVLCDSDAKCKDTPYTPEDLLPRLPGKSPLRRKQKRSPNLGKTIHPSLQSAEVPKSRNASPALSDSTANLKSTLKDISSPFNLTSRINVLNKILSLGKAQTQDSSAANLKIVICEIMSPYITSSELPWESMGANVHRTFCFTNASLLESFFQAFRSQISQLQQDPQYQVTFVEETVSFLSLISRVQNDTSLWHFLLMAPDVVQGSLRMKDIFAFLQNTSSALMASQQVSPPVMSNDGIKTIHNRVLRLLSFLNCSEQGKNNSSTMADICNLFITWKDNQSSVSQMEEVWRKIKLPEFDGEDFRRAIFSRDLETVQKSLYLLKGFQQHLNRNKSENLNPFTESVGNETIQRLYEILKLGMNILYDYKLRKPLNKETIDEVYNFTSLLLQKDFNGTSIFNTAAHWKEIQSAFKLASVIWDLAFLNKTNFNTVKRWDIIKMKISHGISSFPEDIKNYLYAMQKIPSLYSDSLLKPTINEVFQEQLFTFQKIFAHVMNVNMMSRYYLLRNVFELMETIQNSTDEDLWKELDGDWRTVEKLRSAKWNNTDIIAYQQFLDILHNHLYTLNNGSDVLFNKELDQLIEFATCMLREYGGEASRVANISMTIEAIQKTLYILKDLQKKINISTLETIDLVFNFDNKNTGRLLEILRVGMKILYDNRLGEASDKEKIDAVYNFSHLLLQKEFNKTFLQHNTSLETKVLDLLHLVLSPFLVENNNRNEKPQNCSVQDILHIILQMLLKNITLSESLPGSHCKFLFTSMDIQTRTMENQTFTELFQLAIRNLEQTPEFASIFKNNNEYFSRELSCIIQSLQFSSSFLSNLNTVSNFKNLWIEEKYQTLTAISKELPQSNATCLIPGFQNMDSVFKSYPLNILIPIILNETDLKSQNFSGSSLDWNRLPLSTASLLPTAPQWNASIYELVQMVQNASNQPEWRRFSRVWKSIGNLMITKWNLTEVDSSVKLLEMLKKALNVVDIGLAPRKAKAHQFLHNSSLGMKPSNLEDIFSLLKLFLNSTSATNNKPDLERMFKRFASPNEIPAERLFYTNPYSEKIQRFLNLTRVIWYKLILNKELLSLQKLLATMAKVNITQHYLLISSLPKLMQRIQNSTDGAQWNDLNSYWHIAEILQSMKWSSTNVIAYKSLLDALQKHLRTVQNGSGLLFSNELEKLVKLASQEYGGEDAREANVSEYLQAVQRSIFIINNLQQKFNISELETINQWMNFDNNSTQRLLEIFRVGMKILSDARLGEASNIEKLDAVYNFSHLLLQKKFNKTSLQHNTFLEAKVLDLLYLALSPFLEEGNNDNKKLQNCSVHDIFYITLQMLFKNATLSESLPGSLCKFLFTSMDIQIRTTENKSFTELFQLAIRNLEQTPEFASIFKNNSEYFSRELSCIIQSLQFSSSFLSDLNTVSHFKNPWIEGKYQTLTAISKELLQSNTTCLPPPFQSMTRVFNSHPLSSFIVFILNEMDMNSQNFSSSSVDWKNLFILFSDVQADVQRNSRVYELLQMVQSAPRLSEWNNFSRVWEAVDNLLSTKWNLTEAAGYVKLLEVMKRDLADSELASGILETAHYVLKKLNSSDLPSLLKMDLNPESAPNRANFDTVLDSVAHPFSVMAETLFNKTLTWNEREQTLSPNSLVAQFLFLELENAILQVSADNIYKPYLICLMNVSGSQDNELTDNITLLLNHAQLKEAPFTQNDTSEKHASIPEILRLKVSLLKMFIPIFKAQATRVIFKLPSSSSRQRRAIPSSLSLPPLVNYTIRMSSRISQTTNRIRERIWTVGPHNSASQSQIYSRAFIYIQDSIERAIIELQTGKSPEEIAVQVQATPYPCYNKDMFLSSVTYSLPFALMAAWSLFIAAFVKKLVQEKDLRLYEYMKMMGVNSSSHFIAWFIESATFLLITVTFLIIILKVGNILPKINVVILFLYLMDYSFSIIAMCYLISVFFNNTNIAALVGSLIYSLTFSPFIVLLVIENHLSFSVKSLLSLLSPTAFSYASQYIARYEEQGIGLQWDNMYSSPMTGDNTSFGWMCWLILIDSFIYFILGWYIRNVFPGKYGMAAPWYFPLLPSYWAERYGYIPLWNEKRCSLLFTKLLLRKEAAFTNKMYVKSALPPNLEPEPPNLTVGVSLHGITKTYGSKDAVENLSLNFYEENITSLLGHNGAGKTTTISILTGLFPASSGTIFVYGKDIRTDQDLIRKNMGVCMQHNVLFSYLTAKEHLLLYGYIKVPHWSEQELDEEVKRTLKDTGLYNHRHKLTGSLSGGMKRKLSIAIAFLGGSRVVILDEPTTGVDPCSRRSIWEIISKNKKGRTIILSTHHLDEAEVLSDRIAFLEHGGLKCCGSPFYLKETFGDGYHLTLTKKKCPNQTLTEEYDTSAVTSLIQSHLPEAYLKEDVGGELVYVLPPFNSRVSGAYQSLLRALDTGLSDLHIGCYGISDTTVEEVFLNLTKDLEKDKQHDPGLSQQVPGPSGLMDSKEMSLSTDSFTERDDQALVRSKRVTGLPLLLKKTTAVFIKRFHHTRRNLKGFFTQGILPVIFVTVAMGLSTLRTEVAEYPELHLSPSLYGSSGQADFFGNFNETTDALVASMLSFPGTDNTCLNESNSVCLNDSMLGQWVFHGNQSTRYSACNCTDSSQTCPKIDFSPPHKRTFSSRMIYNLTGHDVETYLLATAKDFLQKRYGGWSFGLPLTTDLKFDIRPVPADRTLTKVWYNPEGYHSLPAYLNSLNNFILRANMPKNESSKYGISVVSHPYPGGQSKEQVMLSSLLDILVSMSVLIGYSITTASFVLYVVKEHQTKAKQLQHISGIGVTSYWVTNFIYDLVLFMVPVALSIGVISAFQIPAFFNDNNLVAVFLLMMMFGYATFSWMYLLAGIFKETGMAFIVYVSLNLSFSINTIITHSVVFLLSQEKATDQGLYDLSEILRHVFLISPQFCFGYGLIELSQHQALMGFLKAYGVDYPDRTFEMDRISSKLLGMFIQGTIFFAIRLLMHDGMIQKVWSSILEFLFDKVHGRPPRLLEAADEDKDVQAERERVESGQADVDMVQLQSLTKIYHLPLRRIMAVKNVSIGIPAGECFGLLGVNGAGKTTIFKMLTGDIGATSGRLRVRDQTGSLSDIDDTHWSLFGYCPQEDALDDLLTVEEHMYYYARLHGIPEKEIKGIVRQLLHRLNLMPYKDRVTSMCSYGTNRKLSTALALIGNPSILLLDEPSSGMDPNAKRHLWKIISEEVQNQCSVILTSHSMEECEALCTRLAIMVNGRFQCLGSLQHIKSRFGRGFTVKMHLMSSAVSTEALTELMQSHFPNTCLKDRHLNTVEYHVPISAGGVANIFDLLETNKIAFKIRHFSVSQTTLEEVFINFAKDQTGADNADASTDVGSDCSDTSSQDTNINAIC